MQANSIEENDSPIDGEMANPTEPERMRRRQTGPDRCVEVYVEFNGVSLAWFRTQAGGRQPDDLDQRV